MKTNNLMTIIKNIFIDIIIVFPMFFSFCFLMIALPVATFGAGKGYSIFLNIETSLTFATVLTIGGLIIKYWNSTYENKECSYKKRIKIKHSPQKENYSGCKCNR